MVEPTPHVESYRRAQQLADAGRHEEALAALGEYLRQAPDDGQALNDAGALLYSAGRFDEAIDHLRRAIERLTGAPIMAGRGARRDSGGPGPDGSRGQAVWNLAEVLLAAGRPAEVLPLMDDLERVNLLTADLANRAATAMLDHGDAAGAIEALIRSYRLAPDQERLLPLYARVRQQRPKVAFICPSRDTKFLRDLHALTSARFETRLFEGGSEEELLEALRGCDIAWVEWCTEAAMKVSKLPKVCRTVVRLHRYEAFVGWPKYVCWENIDALITVGNSRVMDHLRRTVPDLEARTRVIPIPNGVDLDRFAFRSRPRGKNLAYVGHLNLHKNPMLVVHAFQKLHAIDPEFRLFFAGNFQDDGVLEAYLNDLVQEMGLADVVAFQGWQRDVAAWLEDKHYLVTGSVVEGHPVGVLEGMARGLKPVIHMFPGCRDFFPEEYLWRTLDEFCRRILADPYEPQAYRDYVRERFSLRAQWARVNDLFLEFERRPMAKPLAPAAGIAPGVGVAAARGRPHVTP